MTREQIQPGTVYIFELPDGSIEAAIREGTHVWHIASMEPAYYGRPKLIESAMDTLYAVEEMGAEAFDVARGYGHWAEMPSRPPEVLYPVEVVKGEPPV